MVAHHPFDKILSKILDMNNLIDFFFSRKIILFPFHVTWQIVIKPLLNEYS